MKNVLDIEIFRQKYFKKTTQFKNIKKSDFPYCRPPFKSHVFVQIFLTHAIPFSVTQPLGGRIAPPANNI